MTRSDGRREGLGGGDLGEIGEVAWRRDTGEATQEK